jgi:hypothetical protein
MPSMNLLDPDTSSPIPSGNTVVLTSEGTNHKVKPPLGLKYRCNLDGK